MMKTKYFYLIIVVFLFSMAVGYPVYAMGSAEGMKEAPAPQEKEATAQSSTQQSASQAQQNHAGQYVQGVGKDYVGRTPLPPKTAAVGEIAPDFTLKSCSGEKVSLSHYAGKYVVLEWVNYECPFVKKFYNSGEMQKLQKEYESKGVIWLAICSSAPGKQGHYDAKKAQDECRKHGSNANAYLLDKSGAVGRLYEAKTTPHMFVVSPEGKLIYAGAMDDKPSTHVADIAQAKNYVRQALDEAMAGKSVSTPSTQSYGCGVKYGKM